MPVTGPEEAGTLCVEWIRAANSAAIDKAAGLLEIDRKTAVAVVVAVRPTTAEYQKYIRESVFLPYGRPALRRVPGGMLWNIIFNTARVFHRFFAGGPT
jgi:hypothetical protein